MNSVSFDSYGNVTSIRIGENIADINKSGADVVMTVYEDMDAVDRMYCKCLGKALTGAEGITTNEY